MFPGGAACSPRSPRWCPSWYILCVREVLELVASAVFLYGIIYVVIRFDERRLSPKQLERAWPASSRDVAVLYFSLIALFLHFPRTRGVLLGVPLHHQFLQLTPDSQGSRLSILGSNGLGLVPGAF